MKKKNSIIMIFIFLQTMIFSFPTISIINVSADTPFDPVPPISEYENATWGFDNQTIMGWEMEIFFETNGSFKCAARIPLLYNVCLAYGYDPNSGYDLYGGLLYLAYFDPVSRNVKTNMSLASRSCSLTNFSENVFWTVDPISLGVGGMNPIPAFFIPYNDTGTNNENNLLLEFCAMGLANDPQLSDDKILGKGCTPFINRQADNSLIRIENDSTGSYVEFFFYNNGTLKKGSIGMNMTSIGMGGSSSIRVVYNFNRIFDYNPIDEVEWDIGINDSLYYDVLNNNTRIQITGIKNQTLPMLGGNLQSIQTVQVIEANISVWNETLGWKLISENYTISMANDYDSIYYYGYFNMLNSPMILTISMPFMVPSGTTGTQLGAFMEFLLTMIAGQNYTLDFTYLDYGFSYSLTNSTDPTKKIDAIVDYYSTGLLKLKLMDYRIYGYQYYFAYHKNHTSFTAGYVSLEFTPITQIPAQIKINLSLDDMSEILFSVLERNPLNQSLPEYVLPNDLLYIDLTVLNSTTLNESVGDSISMTIQLEYYDYDNLQLWYYNTTLGEWEEIPYVDLGENNITFTLDNSSIIALSGIQVSGSGEDSIGYTPFYPTPTEPGYEGATWGFDKNTIMGWKMGITVGAAGLSPLKFMEVPLIFNISLDYEYNSELMQYFYEGLLTPAYFDSISNTIKTEQSSTPKACSLTNFTSSTNKFMIADEYNPSQPLQILLAPLFIPYNETSIGNPSDLLLEFCAESLVSDPTIETYLGLDCTPSWAFISGNSFIRLENSSTGAYAEYVFYDNGTLKSAIISFIMNQSSTKGDPVITPMVFNITRTFDFNPLDDIEWDVNIGDTLYFGQIYNETKFQVTAFRNETRSPLSIVYSSPQTIQIVEANMSIWNNSLEEWILIHDNITIGMANEYFSLGYLTSPSVDYPLLVPIGANGEDLAGFLSIMTIQSFLMAGTTDLLYDIELFKHGFSFRMTNMTNPLDITGTYLDYFSNGILKIGKFYKNLGTEPIRLFFYRDYKNLTAGNISLNFTPEVRIPVQIIIDLALNYSTGVLYSTFEYNPLNESNLDENLTDGFLYIDLTILNSTALNESAGDAINITIQLEYYDYDNLQLWYYNTTLEKWEEIPYFELSENKIMFSVDHASLFAVSGIYSEPEGDGSEDIGPGAIPFGNIFLLFMLIGIFSSIIYILKKKRS